MPLDGFAVVCRVWDIFHLPSGPRTFRYRNRVWHFIMDEFVVIHNKIMPPDSRGMGRAVLLEVSGRGCFEEGIFERAASRCPELWRSPAPPEDSDDEPYFAIVEGLTLDLAAGQWGGSGRSRGSGWQLPRGRHPRDGCF